MDTLLFSCTIYNKKHSNLAGFFLAMGTICLVILMVNVFIGERNIPKILQGTNGYFLTGGLILMIPAIYILILKRTKLRIYKSGSGILLSILTIGHEAICLNSPFNMEGVWYLKNIGRGIKARELYLTFYENQIPLVTLTHIIGMEHNLPVNFRFVDILKTDYTKFYSKDYTKGKPRIGNSRFTCRKLLYVNELLKDKTK